MCTIFEILNHNKFYQKGIEYNIFYINSPYNENNKNKNKNENVYEEIKKSIENIFSQNAKFDIPENFYGELTNRIIYINNKKQDLYSHYSFSPFLRWGYFLAFLQEKEKNILKDVNTPNTIINVIIENLFNTNFSIDSVLDLDYYKNLDTKYKKNEDNILI